MTARRMQFSVAALLVLLVWSPPLSARAVEENQTPNFVVIFIDDMGYGDIGPFGSTINKTPHLDKMAKEGICLTSFYVSNTACTPSRSALMTGTYADRIGMDHNVSVVFPGDARGLNPNEITIADMLKEVGYVTGCFGKWHLGDQVKFLPLAQGFDEYAGIPYSNDMWKQHPYSRRWKTQPVPPLTWIEGNEVVAHIPDGKSQALLADAVTDAAVDFIKRNHDKPFFAYVPHAYVHLPRYTLEERAIKAEGDVTRAQIEEVDASVGRILDTIRELGIENNTLVLFTSDNGGSLGTSMGPLRGFKGGQKYEGHMRVPTIAWWPNTIPAGSVSAEIGATIDVLPTLAALADGKVPTDRIIDGKDISNVLLGKPGAKSPHELLYYEHLGIRRGPWKLVRLNKNKEELYNLDDDLGETKNLIKQHPDIAAELAALLNKHRQSVAGNKRKAGFVGAPKPLATAKDLDRLPSLAEYRNQANVSIVEGVSAKDVIANSKRKVKGKALGTLPARADDVPDKVLLDFNMKTPPPKDWQVEGYAFGTHQPNPKERQKAAVASRNQRYGRTGRMTSPAFVIDSDYLKVTCAGTFHPTRVAMVLIVDGKDVRSCSPERGYGFLGAQLEKPVRLLQPPEPAKYVFDVRPLRGKAARIELRDQHSDGCFFEVKVAATDRKPAAETKVITTAAKWLPDRFETTIRGDFLLLPVGPRVGTPLQPITVEIDGREVLSVDLPLAFGSIEVAGYLPVYDLTGHQGKKLKVSFHSYEGKQPSKNSAPFLVQRQIPGREVSDRRPAFHIHNRIGLLNDPNGLVYHNGEYHLCHQFNYNVSHVDWAHYVSKDLVHWEERPIALFHDAMGSMHSGSGAVDVLNTSGWQTGDTPPVILAYTASFGCAGNDKIQRQCIAYSTDGARTFTKFEGNPVLGKSQHLARGSDNARDPKVFWFSPTRGRDPKAKDGHWVMVLFEGGGLNIYTSDNLRDWDRHGSIPGFHECPELFPLAVDGDPNDVRWIMYGGSGQYHIGSFDGKSFTPQTKNKIPMYHGGRCYAAQTFNNTEEGFGGQPRRIQVGWQGGRSGQLSTPVELTLRTTPLGLRVCKLPVKEITNLYTRSVKLDGTTLGPSDVNPLAALRGGLYDIDLVADLSQAKELVLDIRGTKLVINVTDHGLTLDNKRRMKIPATKTLSLRLVVDNTSIDVYFGEHGLYYSPRMAKPSSKTLSIETIDGAATFTKLQVHELKSIWNNEGKHQ